MKAIDAYFHGHIGFRDGKSTQSTDADSITEENER